MAIVYPELEHFNSHADAITRGHDGKNYFVEPWLEKMTMGELLLRLENEADSNSEICYLQSQNGNLFSNSGSENSEFEPLLLDIPESIPWATEALKLLMFGSETAQVSRVSTVILMRIYTPSSEERNTLRCSRQPKDGVYKVIRESSCYLIVCRSFLSERTYPHATYTRESPGSPIRITASPSPPIRWSSVQDPTDPALLPPEAKPLHISLQAGDTLYLPVGWWHHVRQSGLTIALNWWYDVEIRGMNWVWLNFLRGESEDLPDGNE